MQPSEFLPRLIDWAEHHPLVRMMLLTSTRAVPHAVVDALSDYDVVLVVSDIRPFAEDRHWVADFGPLLVSYWDPLHPEPEYGIEQLGNVIQYADGLKIDFTLWPLELWQQIRRSPTLPAELDAGYRVLLDKDQLTVGLAAPTYTAYIPPRPDNAAYQQWIEEFFSNAPYVAKCLWRDELLPAKWCLDEDMKQLYLRRMLEWRVELDQHWSLPTGARGKGLKKKLPPELWAQLEQCYAGAEIDANWTALFHTLALFRQIAIIVGESLGFTYPEELDRRVHAYVQTIRQLPRP